MKMKHHLKSLLSLLSWVGFHCLLVFGKADQALSSFSPQATLAFSIGKRKILDIHAVKSHSPDGLGGHQKYSVQGKGQWTDPPGHTGIFVQ